ncbi:MAG: exodeoxyribonuclease III [Rhodovibrionaceae bacterium]|nr:exodeoxyribonuclease III [Rhodovibrionaceae bacterium]
MKIASWNVNSIRKRIGNVLDWLRAAEPDVALLQELKCEEENLPRLELEDLGYHVAALGQKSYNGVAILARAPLEDLQEGLPGDEEDTQARYLEVTTNGVRVASIYLPNGNPVGGPKFDYKLAWMRRLQLHAAELLSRETPTVLGGDYNVIPMPEDAYDPGVYADDALYQPESRNAFRTILNLGYTDAFRALHHGGGHYTYWDYQGRAFAGDLGIRIDHLLLSPQAADRLQECQIDREPRGKENASDHTPIWCTLEV